MVATVVKLVEDVLNKFRNVCREYVVNLEKVSKCIYEVFEKTSFQQVLEEFAKDVKKFFCSFFTHIHIVGTVYYFPRCDLVETRVNNKVYYGCAFSATSSTVKVIAIPANLIVKLLGEVGEVGVKIFLTEVLTHEWFHIATNMLYLSGVNGWFEAIRKKLSELEIFIESLTYRTLETLFGKEYLTKLIEISCRVSNICKLLEKKGVIISDEKLIEKFVEDFMKGNNVYVYNIEEGKLVNVRFMT